MVEPRKLLGKKLLLTSKLKCELFNKPKMVLWGTFQEPLEVLAATLELQLKTEYFRKRLKKNQMQLDIVLQCVYTLCIRNS